VKKYGISNVRVLTLAKNKGKGGAVRLVSDICWVEVIPLLMLLMTSHPSFNAWFNYFALSPFIL
jgi:hypothetical protein